MTITASYNRAALEAEARKAAKSYGIPEDLFVAQINAESDFNPMAKNGNAQGIAQFIPATAAAYGVTNPYDPTAALWGAAAYNADLYKQTGSYVGMLEKYGTIPKGETVGTERQTALENMAAAIDGPGAGGDGGTAVNTDGIFSWKTLTTNISDFFGRGALIILGIVLLIIAVFMFRPVRNAAMSAVAKVPVP